MSKRTYWIEHETSGDLLAVLSGVSQKAALDYAVELGNDSAPGADFRNLVVYASHDEPFDLDAWRSFVLDPEGNIIPRAEAGRVAIAVTEVIPFDGGVRIVGTGATLAVGDLEVPGRPDTGRMVAVGDRAPVGAVAPDSWSAEGYDLDDPKHPTFHDRYAGAADLARKRAKGE